MKQLLAVLAATLLVAAALSAAIAASRGGMSWWTDRASIRAAPDLNRPRSVLWTPASPVRGPAAVDEYEPKISADGSTMLLVQRRPGSNADLFTSRWTQSGWAPPEPIDAVNSASDELGPELSADGASLYFYSDRPGGLGGYDLWRARRNDTAWSEPVNLGPHVNSPANEYGPVITPDASRLVFATNRSRSGEVAPTSDAWTATVRERRTRHDYDLLIAPLRDGLPSEPAQPIAAINTADDEGAPAISPAGDFLYFASDRPGGLGGYDLWRSRLRGTDVATPEPLGPAVNSAANDLDPGLSTDGFRLYFSSDRAHAEPQQSTPRNNAPRDDAPRNDATRQDSPPIASPDASEAQPPSTPSRYALWMSSSREVFLEHDHASFWDRFVAAWRTITPWLLLLLLGPLMLLLARRLASDATLRHRVGRLGLLAQCLIASVIVHSMLASLFAVWKVSAGIGELLQGEPGGDVALETSGTGDGIVTQLRGETEGAALPALALPELDMGQAPAAATNVILATSSIDVATPPLPTLVTNTPPSPVDLLTAAPPAAVTSPDRVPTIPIALERLAAQEFAPRLPAAASATPQLNEAAIARPAPITSPLDRAALGVPAMDLSAIAPPAPASSGVQRAIDAAIPADAALTLAPAAPAQTTPRTPTAARSLDTLPPAPPSTAAAFPHIDAPAITARTEPTRALPPASASSGIAAAPAAPLPSSSLAASSSPSLDLPTPPLRSAAPSMSTSLPAPAAAPSAPARAAIPPGSLGASANSVNGAAAATTSARIPSLEPARPASSSAEPMATIAAPRTAGRTSLPAAPLAASGVATPVPARLDVHTPTSRVASAPPSSATDVLSAAPSRTLDRIGAPAALPAGSLGSSAPAMAPRVPPVPEPKETFAQRDPILRDDMLARMGGSQETEQAVARALDWLARHQEPDGRWSGRGFDDRCQCGGRAQIDADAALTAMTLLCFLGAGHTHTADSPHRDAVARGLDWLIARQDPSGDLRQGETMYGQTIATVALCEALAMTRDPRLVTPAQRAIAFVLAPPATRGPGAQDTSVIGWQVMAVESARRAGLSIPLDTFDAARAWLDAVADARAPGRYAHTAGGPPSPAMTAEAMFVQQILGRTRDDPRMRQSADFILATPPRWKDGAPTYYWYYATLALFQHQGDAWRTWNDALVPELLAHQRRDGNAAGSWDPQDEWSKLGGRIYQTAVCTLSLEVYYRYRPAGLAVPTAPAQPDAPVQPGTTAR